MIGSSNCFALFNVSTIKGTLCPSIGPIYVIPISSKYIPGTNNCLIESFDFLRIVVNSFPIPGILNKDCSTFPLNSTYSFLVRTLFKYADIPPTFSAIDILLSFKILTGRKNGFENQRQFHGMSGFPKRKESDCDAFHSGHSSMSLSAALGMVTARDINHTDETIVAVIGDGALSGGMANEALNNMARLRKEKKNLIIILNDNKMSIAENGLIP